ncbi:MAG: hypothetical protein PHQ26_10145 [Bacteroidales bacterium]|nr:hypothetical protein [Bacteroidales bacterium]
MRHHSKQTAWILFLLPAFALFFSCEKEESSAPEHQIARIHDAWYSNCNGTIEADSSQLNLSYNVYDHLSVWAWDNEDYNLFTYNDNGKLEGVEEHWMGKVTRIQFSWEGNTVTRLSTTNDVPDSVKQVIECNSEQEIVRIDGYNRKDAAWIHAWYELYSWQNNNLTQIERFSNTGNGSFELERTSTFTHENSFNPFRKHQALVLWDPTSPLCPSKNNVRTWTTVAGLSLQDTVWHATFDYTYNAYNYPTQLTIEMVNDTCFSSETIDFTYLN